MSLYNYSLIVFGILYCYLSSVNALDCFQCSTKEHGDKCWNPKQYKEEILSGCAEDHPFCRKILSNIDGDVSVLRQCGTDAADPPKCAERTGTKDVKMTYCECDEDECNNAESHHIKFAMITFISGLLSLVILS